MLKGQLEQILDQLTFLRFEMALVIGALVLLVVGLISKRHIVHRVGFAIVLVFSLFVDIGVLETQTILSGSLQIGPLESYVKMLFAAFAIWIVFYPTARKQTPEFYFLMLSMVIGSSFMVSANHLLVAYLAIELTSFTSYIITNFNFQKKSFEAGIKYLIFGGVSSAVMLYGISIIYGIGGGLEIDSLYLHDSNPFLAFGVLALLGGLLFKVSVFPFHIWTPSAYQEAPTDAVAVLSVVPKVAGFVLLHRVLGMINPDTFIWVAPMLIFAGVGTLLVGTLGALGQTNIKRLMAYGAVAHSGLLLGCIFVSGDLGVAAFAWYALVYALMNLALFHAVAVFEQQGIDNVSDLAGLGKTQSYFGGLMVVIMIALVGLPPTAGFTAKFYLFSALWQEFQAGSDYYLLGFLIVSVLTVVFSLFYYFRIPFYYFLKSGSGSNSASIDLSHKIFATILVMILLWFFLSPEILNNIVLNFNAVDW